MSLPIGAWFSLAQGEDYLSGDTNLLTEDCGTLRLGQGAAAHNVGVEVTRTAENT